MFRNLFQGRQGIDNLSIAMVVLSTILSQFPYTWILSYAIFALAIFRAFSRNTFKRQLELQKFNVLADPVWRFLKKTFSNIRGLFTTERMKWNQRKSYVFFKCIKCGKTLRLPRGKGKLQVKCPTCGDETVRRT